QRPGRREALPSVLREEAQGGETAFERTAHAVVDGDLLRLRGDLRAPFVDEHLIAHRPQPSLEERAEGRRIGGVAAGDDGGDLLQLSCYVRRSELAQLVLREGGGRGGGEEHARSERGCQPHRSLRDRA